MKRLRTVLVLVAIVALSCLALWRRERPAATGQRARVTKDAPVAAEPSRPAVAVAAPTVAPASAPAPERRMRYVELTLRGDQAETGPIALAALGAECVQELDDVRGLYAIPSGQFEAACALPAVAVVSVPDRSRKVSAEAGLILQTAGYEGGFLASFHATVPLEDALAAVARAGLSTTDAEYRDGSSLLVRGAPANVEALVEDEQVYQLWPQTTPVCNHNSYAAIVSRVNQLHGAPVNLRGQGVTLAMWELERPRTTHQEFGGRIVAQNGTTGFHPTHVGCTLIGEGLLGYARGMAPAAQLRSYIVVNDAGTTYGAWYSQRNNYVAANNSWGYQVGWSDVTWHGPANTGVDPKFGKYTIESRNADDATEDDDVIAVVSAGNERTDVAARGAHLHFGFGSTLYGDQHGPDFQEKGFDTLTPSATAKNPIMVGASDGSGSMASFSSWGPCDDGRLKPEIVAHGVNLFSASDASDGSYAWSSGTSMSAPVVTGTIGLLTQYMRGRQIGAAGRPRLSQMKALLCHTAVDLGTAGPDYKFGYGLLDAGKALNYLVADAASAGKYMRVRTLTQGGTSTLWMNVQAGQRIKVTLAWADRAGSANTGGNDDTTRALVRDLDLRVIGPGGTTTYMPWVLNPATPSAAAATGNNNVDTIEQVVIASAPVTGWYKVSVRFNGVVNAAVTQACTVVLTHSGDGLIPTTP
jgi:hypothetical protein